MGDMKLHDLHTRLISLEDMTGLRMIPSELDLLLQLYSHGPLTSSQLMRKTKCSIAGFGLVKKRLFECGLIATEKCSDDRRVTYINLAAEFRQRLECLEDLEHITDGLEPSSSR